MTMKRIKFLFAVIVFGLSTSAQDLQVMTFNIRYNNAGDSLNAWPYRKDKVVSQLLFHDVQLLGVQEALHNQMMDLKALLPKFKSVGVGRDGGEKGEYSAIFYDSTRLQALASQTFWLSLTPDVVASKSWDAALTRIVTWIKFKDRKTGKIFFHFNTHFDHVGKVARRESAKLLLEKVAGISGKLPAIVTGDFNAFPTDEPILVIMDKTNTLHLIDSKEISATPHYGPIGTFNGFGPKEREERPIDYIFLRGTWKVKKHASISQTWGGRFASDHFAVLATIGY